MRTDSAGFGRVHGALQIFLLCAGFAKPMCAVSDSIAPLQDARIAFVLEDVVPVPAARATAHPRLNALVSPPDGSHRLFIVDMDGAIFIAANGTLLPRPFLDMARLRKGQFVSAGLEQGLNSIAFHPDFARGGRRGFGKFYTFSTERADDAAPTLATRSDLPAKPAHYDVIAEWTVDATNSSIADPRSRRELLRIMHPLDDHVGGQLAFNPTVEETDSDYGMLYVSVGDGGNTVHEYGVVDKWRTAQDKRLALGKILRINPLQDGAKAYSIPRDNPFIGDAGSLPEVWAYGLRNPERFSWDPEGAHRMLIADIGQKQLEEINIGRKGANYGWSEREGNRIVNHADQYDAVPVAGNDALGGYTAPALAYGRRIGIAITGGYVYRGSAIPELRGFYIFGDIANGRIFATDVAKLVDGKQAVFFELPLEYRAQRQSLLAIVKYERVDLRFGMDDKGNIYVLSKRDGMVRRLARATKGSIAIQPVEHALDR